MFSYEFCEFFWSRLFTEQIQTTLSVEKDFNAILIEQKAENFNRSKTTAMIVTKTQPYNKLQMSSISLKGP